MQSISHGYVVTGVGCNCVGHVYKPAVEGVFDWNWVRMNSGFRL